MGGNYGVASTYFFNNVLRSSFGNTGTSDLCGFFYGFTNYFSILNMRFISDDNFHWLIIKFRIKIFYFSKGENERIIFKKSYALKGRRREIRRTNILSENEEIRFKIFVMLKDCCKMSFEKMKINKLLLIDRISAYGGVGRKGDWVFLQLYLNCKFSLVQY